jgi:hypothetical protein
MSPAFAQDFAEGQVWSYRSRPAEEGSVLLINKIEVDPKLGQIFHISVLEVRVKNKRSPSGMTSELPHFPVSRKTLESSCVAMLRTAKPNPEYMEGYGEWRREFLKGKAGVFDIPVSQIVESIEDVINQ